jgi:hypothetical protein
VPLTGTRLATDTTPARNRHYSLVNVHHPVDPRDQTSEVDAPRYRVCFWNGSDSDEYEITGADVPEVLAWADRSAAGRTYSSGPVSLPVTRLAPISSAWRAGTHQRAMSVALTTPSRSRRTRRHRCRYGHPLAGGTTSPHEPTHAHADFAMRR